MHPGLLASIEAEAETNFAENVSTFAELRVPHKGTIDVSGLKHAKIDSERAHQYLNDGTPHILGTQGGSFKTVTYLTGHGSTTAGAVSPTAYEMFIGDIFGFATESAAAGTTLTGGTAAAPTTTASGTFAAGSLAAIGVPGDGAGNGQVHAIGTHATTTLNLLTGLAGAPTNGDVLRSGVNFYYPETPTTTLPTSYRFRVLTANDRYLLHGCVPTEVKVTGTNPGETPMLEVTWSVARWSRTTGGTFPSTLATESALPAPVAGGSLFVQTVGTATRATLVMRSLSIDITHGMEVQKGSGGFGAHQDVVSARRLPTRIKVTVVVDADANTATPTVDGWFTGTNKKHLLATLSCVDGSTVAFYFPNACVVGDRPVQKIDGNVNRYQVEFMAYTGPTTTSDLTLSCMRMYFG